jgi:hypothetical protein
VTPGFSAGSNYGDADGLMAEPVPWMSMEYSLPLRLPPLGALYFKRHKKDEGAVSDVRTESARV